MFEATWGKADKTVFAERARADNQDTVAKNELRREEERNFFFFVGANTKGQYI